MNETIAFRCGLSLVVGIIGLGWLSGHAADPARRGPVSLWLGVPAVGAMLLITAASTVIGKALRDAFVVQGWIWSTLIGAGAFVSTLWASSIAVQVAQNIFYRRVGSPSQPIRWYAGQRVKRRKRRSS